MMRLFLLTLILTAGLSSAAAQPARVNANPRAVPPVLTPPEPIPLKSSKDADAALFINGDLLLGDALGMSSSNRVQWRRSDVSEPFDLLASAISEIHFQTAPAPEHSFADCAIHFYNGDKIDGTIVTVENDEIALRAWYAGILTIPLSTVHSIAPQPRPQEPLFSGPDGLEGWTRAEVDLAVGAAGFWRYKDNAFYADMAASIARDINLPGVARVQFDLAWRGVLNLAVALYTDSLQPIKLQFREAEPDFADFYSLQIYSHSVDLLTVTKLDPLKRLGVTPAPALSQKTSASFDVLINKPKRTVTLLIDDAVVKQWVDPDPFNTDGDGVRFVHQGQGLVKLSNLRVSEWDGRFPQPLSGIAASENDLIYLRNGDSFHGKLLTVKDGKARFQMGERELEVPLERVSQVIRPNQEPPPPLRGPDVIRAHFKDGGRLTFELGEWQGDHVRATTSFGPANFNRTAFNRFEFLRGESTK